MLYEKRVMEFVELVFVYMNQQLRAIEDDMDRRKRSAHLHSAKNYVPTSFTIEKQTLRLAPYNTFNIYVYIYTRVYTFYVRCLTLTFEEVEQKFTRHELQVLFAQAS